MGSVTPLTKLAPSIVVSLDTGLAWAAATTLQQAAAKACRKVGDNLFMAVILSSRLAENGAKPLEQTVVSRALRRTPRLRCSVPERRALHHVRVDFSPTCKTVPRSLLAHCHLAPP